MGMRLRASGGLAHDPGCSSIAPVGWIPWPATRWWTCSPSSWRARHLHPRITSGLGLADFWGHPSPVRGRVVTAR